MSTLFEPTRVGDIDLANRIVMAPLTRNRAVDGLCAGPMTVTYYRQRASAGLIITEASQISPMAQGYIGTPGIYSDAQVAAWRAVTDAVHAEGGRIVIQLWHVGRISHVDLLPAGQQPVSCTNRRAQAQTFTANGLVDVSAPRALRDDEIPGLIADYVAAARNAIRAGFDGVEIHAANGYLLDQFLRDSVNDRSGRYGGSMENRARLVIEVAQAVASAIGAGRVGIRISPMATFNDAARDSDPQRLFAHLLDQLDPLGLAYVHVVEGETGGPREPDGAPAFDYAALRRHFHGSWMVNNGYDGTMAAAAVDSGHADLVAIGRAFIANPDLVRRLREHAPLNPLQADKLYGGGAEGYIDYPALP